jgi:Ca2+-binding EF-hand superfamily protein
MTSLSQPEMADLRRAFELLDGEKEGTVAVEELKDLLVQVTDQVDVAGVLQALETRPADAHLTWDDFVQLLTLRRSGSDDRDELRKTFDLFDVHKKGYLDSQDLRTAADSLGESLLEDEIDEMIARASTTGQSRVDFEEFSAIMTKRLFNKE